MCVLVLPSCYIPCKYFYLPTYLLSACVVSEEMYQVVVYMPEDVPFNCRVCCPERPSPWETVVRQEMYNGMKDVLDALLSSHSSMLLQPVPQPVSFHWYSS